MARLSDEQPNVLSNQQRFVGDGSLLHRLNSYQKGEIGLIWTAIR
jgi:hypothetical protein